MLERMLVALMVVLMGVVGGVIFAAWWIDFDPASPVLDCMSDTSCSTTK